VCSPLFTQLLRRGLLGNSVYDKRASGKPRRL
jgi:hypothetical protein